MSKSRQNKRVLQPHHHHVRKSHILCDRLETECITHKHIRVPRLLNCFINFYLERLSIYTSSCSELLLRNIFSKSIASHRIASVNFLFKLHHFAVCMCVYLFFLFFVVFDFQYLAHHFHFNIDTVCNTWNNNTCKRIYLFLFYLQVRLFTLHFLFKKYPLHYFKETAEQTNNLKTSNDRYAPRTLCECELLC